jgi:serine/threonine-protein kinase
MAEGEGTLAGSRVGAYQLGELIGAGQLAEVYQAQHPAMPQPVALKIFMPGVAANTAYMSAMHDIASRVQLLKADYILPIHGFGQEGKLLYLSMPLMYESLRSILQRTGYLPLYRAVTLLRQVATGLAAAHAADIIHRDLKPENVLLNMAGQGFVSDFGVGRDLSPESVERRSLGTLSSLIGTPAYMAPEQLRGQPADQRADVYALGVIVYEMLTGAPPYSGNTIYDVAAKALTTPIPPPSQLVAGINPLFERAILRALARDPTERWPTVQRFIVGLNTALPVRPDASHIPGRTFTTMPLTPHMLGEFAPVIGDEVAIEEVSTEKFPAQSGAAPADKSVGSAGSSGALPTPDLRLFRVRSRADSPNGRRSFALLLLCAALLLLGIVGIGGALLANAAQSGVAMPTRPPATLVPTHPIIGPLNTPFPTATPKPTAAPRPKPTATHAPTATATATPVISPPPTTP